MPELRHDPIQKRWVIIATDRARRPTDFSHNKAGVDSVVFDPFAPGNESKTPPETFAFRADDTQPNTAGWKVRVVPNKFPALKIEGNLDREGVGLYDKMNGIGAHEVVIETPELTESMDKMSVEQLALVLKTYRQRLNDLRRDPRFRYILIFKNHGADAGASLPHPHTQIIATPITPKTVALELESAKNYYYVKERCIFCDIIKQEIQTESRVVIHGDRFIVFCPYASRFPFEMFLMPHYHEHDFGRTSDGDILNMAVVLKEAMTRLNKSLDDPPFNFMLHTAPNTRGSSRRPFYWDTLELDWHWHLEIIPRVTPTAGFEWGTGFYINPVAPENAAAFLRGVKL